MMFKEGRLPFACTVLLFLLLVFQSCNARKTKNNNNCPASSCGTINISHPFRLNTDPKTCGDERYTLSCENSTVALYWRSSTNQKKYYVQEIDYNSNTTRVVDASFDRHDCSSVPRVPRDYGFGGDYYDFRAFGDPYVLLWERRSKVVFVKCANPASRPLYIDRSASCRNGSSAAAAAEAYRYAIIDCGNITVRELMDQCAIETVLPLLPSFKNSINTSFLEIRRQLAYGFEVKWCDVGCKGGCYIDYPDNYTKCYESGSERSYPFRRITYVIYWLNVILNTVTLPIRNLAAYSFRAHPFRVIVLRGLDWLDSELDYAALYFADKNYKEYSAYDYEGHNGSDVFFGILISITLLLVLLQVTKVVCGTPFVIAFLVYKWRRRHLSADDCIEKFLQNQNNFMPIRYSYSDIKRMTGNFKDKLGEGGFGSVFKGKLRSGSLAAIKLLSQSKSNGQDFINEVATIGRIHHRNVVQLIGFCVEGSKRALVYEFMPNGSLNSYIFPGKETVSLSWEMRYKISLGVARGIEYLHCGCHMQILHFDIKPHNILLDEKFLPKVSDFGLAKLYPRNDTIVSLTAARGTIGYIAPELVYKRFGRVSHKADVYSFGMLLLDMAGKRRNLDATTENSSQYFPSCVYDQLLKGKAIGDEDATEEESKIAEKMIVVGLWCIQMKPDDRPPMNKVVEMLEGDLECLELPVLYTEETPIMDGGGGDRDQSSISSSVVDPTESISSIVIS